MKKPLTLKIQLLVTLLPIFFIFTLIVSVVSYSLFYTNTRSYTNNQIEQSSYQCLNNYETFFNSVIDTSNSIERKVSNMDLINEQDDITTYLDDLLSLQSELSNAAIYSLEGEVIASNLNYESVTNATTTDWFINANNNRLLIFFSSIDYLDGLYGFTLSKYVTYNTEQEGGILKLDFDFTNVINLISETDLGNGGHITIYDNNYNVIAIGKMNDIFSKTSINKSLKASSNIDAINKLTNIMDKKFTGICMVNLCDFDSLYGHQRDVEGYARSLEELDVEIPIILNKLEVDDLLIITADHGNDPTFKGNDHTRENVPLILYSRSFKNPHRLEIQDTMANIGSTIADNFEVDLPEIGTSILDELE